MFEDKTLVCKDCGKGFVWTAGEQEFYASRGFENQPQRQAITRAIADQARTIRIPVHMVETINRMRDRKSVV